MRRLILMGVLGLALPAFATDESAPAMEATTPAAEEVAALPDPASDESAMPSDAKPAEPAPELPPVPEAAVARGSFTTAVEQREPVDSITSLESDRDRVYYFTELVGISGREVTHRWAYEGEVVAEVPIAVGGPRWRAYSSKQLDEGRLGEWTVSVVDDTGHVVHTDTLVYVEAAPEPAAAAAMPVEPAAPPAAPAPGDAPEQPEPMGGAASQP